MNRSAFVVIVLGLSAAACGGSTPTTPSNTTPAPSSDFFAGTLSAMGSVPNTFVVSTAGAVEVTLLALTTGAGNVSSVPIALAVGTFTGTVCTPTTTLNATPALKAQLTTTLAVGTFCVNVADPGGVTEDLSFALRVTQHPASSTPTNSTETFSSNLPPGGSASRTFTVNSAGTVTATLTSFGASVDVGFAVGIANVSSHLCTVTAVVTGQTGTVISQPADPSTYCVKLFDIGNLTSNTTSFVITIVHP
jgi:hypothetical protein